MRDVVKTLFRLGVNGWEAESRKWTNPPTRNISQIWVLNLNISLSKNQKKSIWCNQWISEKGFNFLIGDKKLVNFSFYFCLQTFLQTRFAGLQCFLGSGGKINWILRLTSAIVKVEVEAMLGNIPEIVATNMKLAVVQIFYFILMYF